VIDNNSKKIQLSVEIATKLGLISIIFYISYLIIKPFLPIILWGVVLAVSLSPLIDKLVDRFGDRKRVVVGVTTAFIFILIIPTWRVSDSLIDSTHSLVASIEKKDIAIPPPSQKIKDLPIVGERLYQLWVEAHRDLPKAIKPFNRHIKAIISWLIGLIKGAVGAVLATIAAVVIASALLISKESSIIFYKKIMRRVVGERGDEWANLSALTVRSVAVGVVGVAVIQSFFALIGMIIADIPFAPVWAILIMFLTIIQLPALIIIAPMIAYMFSVSNSTSATVFAIYMLLVGASDGVLKPIFMGRGVDIPMLVILIGAIGGMMLMGMLGLFLGAVILALTYKLFYIWIDEGWES
jgi:predicted PurR-regulated permease PerM